MNAKAAARDQGPIRPREAAEVAVAVLLEKGLLRLP